MSDSMVERVAAAIEGLQLFINTVGTEELQICRRDRDGGHSIVSRHPYEADGLTELFKAVSTERARAAIEAMREPTQAMLDAGDEYDMQFVDEGGYPWEYYRVMIDAALKEGQ